MHAVLSLVASLLLLALAVPAQIRLGMRAPRALWNERVHGEEIQLRGKDAPRLTVVAFYGKLPHLLAGDVDYLESLAQRYREHGLRVLVVASSADLEGIERVELATVVVDTDGHTEKEWLRVAPAHHRNLVAVDQDGTVLFYGAPGCGVADLLQRELVDKPDREYEERARAWRMQLVESYDDLAGAPTVELLAPLAERSPCDGLLNGLLYLTYATKANDMEAARRLRRRAIRAMADAPRALAVFADLALRGDPRRPEVWEELRPALEAAGPKAPQDPFVQLALLRSQVATGDGRAAGRQAMLCRKMVVATADGCLDFAMLLAQAETPMIHRDLAQAAVARARKLGGDPRLVDAAEFVVALRCAEDAKRSRKLLSAYIGRQDEFYGLNNDAWYFLTQLPTMGRYDWFSVGLVERLLEDRAGMDYFEFDTAALAMFLVGRVEDAIALQKTALKQGGNQEAEYRDRLRRYQAYRAAAPR